MRDVRETELFADAKAALGVDPRALDEALRAVTWALSREPEIFPTLPGKRTRQAFTTRTARMPALAVYFVVREDEGVVDLLWIEEA